MQEDLHWLEQHDEFWNTCLVKRLSQTTDELYNSHLVFNYWFGEHSVYLTALPTDTPHHYTIYYKDLQLCKDILIDTFITELSKFEAIIRPGSTGAGTNIEIIRRRKKCSKRKHTKSKE